MNGLAYETFAIKRLLSKCAEFAFPNSQGAGDPSPGFIDNDRNHDQMNTSKPGIPNPLPLQEVAQQNHEQTNHDHSCIRDMQQRNEISQNSKNFNTHILQSRIDRILFQR